MIIDRNLIFGAVALRNKYIGRDQFAEIHLALTEDGSHAAADLMVRRGWIDERARGEIDRLVDTELGLDGDDRGRAVSAVTDADTLVGLPGQTPATEAYPESDAVSIPEDQYSTLMPLEEPYSFGGSDLTSPQAPASGGGSAAPAADSYLRYGAGRIQGEGGLGRVWATRDSLLNRTVALKEIRPERADSREAVSGFLREAQITGQLEHPNIVPIYDLGRKPPGGQPYYTMRLVNGETLTRAIAENHRLRREGKADRLGLARLLNAFVGVCNAVGYAHSRDVIHRDLKPDNVILGAFGEVIVLDWGLAKVCSEPPGRGECVGASTVEVSGVDSKDRSWHGRVIGTPAYMAPEQAVGDLDRIGPASDVFGLGAILFEILTGQAPNRGRTVSEVLDAAVNGPTPRARGFEPSVPAALDAICARAMARDPSGRYPGAAGLAEDVQKWLADEPVSVYREPPLRRAARFARRHKAWTEAAGVALVVVTLISLIATQWVRRARDAERQAKDVATGRLHQAREAADTLLTGVSRGLEKVPGRQNVRTGLLEKAAAFYEKLAADRSTDLDLRLEAGHALNRLGEVRRVLLNLDAAERAYRQAGALFADASGARPGRAEARLGRAESLVGLGLTLHVMKRNDQAEKAFDAAVSGLRALADAEPADAAVRDRLAFAETSLGNLLYELNKDVPAEAAYRRALARYDALVKGQPGTPSYRSDRARCRGNLAVLLYERGRAADVSGKQYPAGVAYLAAEEAYRGAMDDLKALDLEVPEYRARLAHYRINLALVLRDLKQSDLAGEQLTLAIDGLNFLIARTTPDHADSLVNARVALADLQVDAGDLDQAQRSDLRAAEEGVRLVDANPDVLDYRKSLASAWNHLGIVLAKLGKPADALTYLDRAAAEREALSARHPDLPDLRRDLRYTLSQRCFNRKALGRVPETVADARRLAELSPDSEDDLFNAACYLSWAAGETAPSRPDDARLLRNQAVTHLKQVLSLDPNYVTKLDDPDLAPLASDPGFLALKAPRGAAPK